MTRRRGILLAVLGGIAVAVLLVVGVKAFTGDDSGEACEVPAAAPAEETALMPDGLALDHVGTVTSVTRDGGTVTMQVVSSTPLDQLTVRIQDAVVAAGYQPAGMDNEGDEAEVFFQSGTLAAGQARVEEADCEGQWDIDLVLLDQDA
jgi:hypothetical protein